MIGRRAPVMRARARVTSAGPAMSPHVDMPVPWRRRRHRRERRRQGVSVRRRSRRHAGRTLLLRRLLIRSGLLRRRRGDADRQKEAGTDEDGAAHQWFHRPTIASVGQLTILWRANLPTRMHDPSRPKVRRACRQKWCVQSASSRMIGIGMPITQSRMERITSVSLLPARAATMAERRNGSVRVNLP